MKFQFLLLSTLIGLSNAVASDAQTTSDDVLKTVEIDNVVVSATGTPRLLTESPVPVAIITQKEIESTSATTLTQAMELLSPSFSMQTNSMGTTMMFNGLEDDYFVLLVDGQQMQMGDALDRIDLSDIQRIEVLSGASSLLYGTNAIGGVISIITKKTNESGVSASNTVDFMSKGRINESVNVNVKGKSADASVYYRYQQADSWMLNPYMYSSGELVDNNKIASAAFNSHLAGFRANADITNKFRVSANASYYDYKTDRPQDMSYSYNLDHESVTYGLGAEYDLGSKNNKLVATYIADNYKSQYSYFSGSNEGNTIEQDRTHYHDANLRSIFYLGESHILTTGTEFELNTLRKMSNTPAISFIDAYTISLYAQDEITITERLQSVIGARLTHHKSFGNHVTPNASLMYKAGNLNFRATYAAGYRTPDLNDIYATRETASTGKLTIGNLDLEPETSDYISLSAEYNIKRLSLSFTAFQNYLSNMIEVEEVDKADVDSDIYTNLDNYTEISQYHNVGKAKINGLSASVGVSTGIGLKLNMGYTFLDTNNLDDDTPIHQSVRNSATFVAAWAKSWREYTLDLSLNGRYNGERYISSSSYDNAPAYQIWDFNTYHTFTFEKFRLKPGIGISNIFNYTDDQPYTAYYATLNPGRSYYASLAIYFK